jgi:hypothetical protein
MVASASSCNSLLQRISRVDHHACSAWKPCPISTASATYVRGVETLTMIATKRASTHRSIHQMRDDIVFCGDNLPKHSQPTHKNTSHKRIHPQIQTNSSHLLQLLYFPSHFLHPLVFGLWRVTPSMHSNAQHVTRLQLGLQPRVYCQDLCYQCARFCHINVMAKLR